MWNMVITSAHNLSETALSSADPFCAKDEYIPAYRNKTLLMESSYCSIIEVEGDHGKGGGGYENHQKDNDEGASSYNSHARQA
jgi:hypothetical protein